jgi:hypothetical protein
MREERCGDMKGGLATLSLVHSWYKSSVGSWGERDKRG